MDFIYVGQITGGIATLYIIQLLFFTEATKGLGISNGVTRTYSSYCLFPLYSALCFFSNKGIPLSLNSRKVMNTGESSATAGAAVNMVPTAPEAPAVAERSAGRQEKYTDHQVRSSPKSETHTSIEGVRF